MRDAPHAEPDVVGLACADCVAEAAERAKVRGLGRALRDGDGPWHRGGELDDVAGRGWWDRDPTAVQAREWWMNSGTWEAA